jgi:hypothetical protein
MATMYPAFLLRQAHFEIGNMRAAAIEFRKVIDQPGLTLNFALGALARLELAKTYSASGEIAKIEGPLRSPRCHFEGSRREHTGPAIGEKGADALTE